MDEYGNKQDNTKYNLGLFGGVFASDFDFEEINDGDIFLEAWSVCRIDDLFIIVWEVFSTGWEQIMELNAQWMESCGLLKMSINAAYHKQCK